jgi:hypothetical protein
MSDKESLLRKARERGCFQALKLLIEGTEELTDWKPEVGKNADRISYKAPKTKRVMVRYGGLDSAWHGLEADVYQGDNQFGAFFGVTEGEVIARLRQYLPHARDGYETGYEDRRADWVPIANEADARQFLSFLRSFHDSRAKRSS